MTPPPFSTHHLVETLLAVDSVTVLLPLLIIVLLRRKRRHYLRRADEAQRAQQAGVTSGREAIVHGVVDSEDGQPPIAVAIRESRYRPTNSPPRWGEDFRDVEARPFVLCTGSGERVRVEPDDQVLLIRALDRTEYAAGEEHKYRTRKTALQPGESVYVVGALARPPAGAGPYRQSGAPPTMRPPERGRMVVSTEPLRERFETKANAFGRRAASLVLFAVFVHLWLLTRLDVSHLWLLLRHFGYHNAVVDWLFHHGGGAIWWGALFFPCGVPAALGAGRLLTPLRPWYEGNLDEADTASESAEGVRRRERAAAAAKDAAAAPPLTLDAEEVRAASAIVGRVEAGAGAVRAACYVQGPRDRDDERREITATEPVTPDADGSFRLVPVGPLSWEGSVVRVSWAAELVEHHGGIPQEFRLLNADDPVPDQDERWKWERDVVQAQKQAAKRAILPALWTAPFALIGLVILVAVGAEFCLNGEAGACWILGFPAIFVIAAGVKFVRLLPALRNLSGWLLVPVHDLAEQVWPGGILKVRLPARWVRPWRWSLVHAESAAWKERNGGDDLGRAREVEEHARGLHKGGALEIKIPTEVPSTVRSEKNEDSTFRRIDWELWIHGRGATRRVPILVLPGPPAGY